MVPTKDQKLQQQLMSVAYKWWSGYTVNKRKGSVKLVEYQHVCSCSLCSGVTVDFFHQSCAHKLSQKCLKQISLKFGEVLGHGPTSWWH